MRSRNGRHSDQGGNALTKVEMRAVKVLFWRGMDAFVHPSVTISALIYRSTGSSSLYEAAAAGSGM